MSCGMLPQIDKQVCAFECWLASHLEDIAAREHVPLLQRFATWDVLARMRNRAERKPVTPASGRFAREQIKFAAGFLTWLAERGTALGDCRQADVDLWRAQHHQHARNALRAFLTWCASGNHIRSIELPKQPINQAQPLGQDQRTRLLGRLLTDEDIPLRTRVAGIIVLLYAQPLTRIVRLTVDDVVCNDDGVLLRLGEPPTPVPAAFAELLQRWISSRDNMNTATNRDSTWLFPGRKAGQPMNPDGTTRPRPESPLSPDLTGAATPQATTHDHRQAGHHDEPSTVE